MNNLNYFPVINSDVNLQVFETYCILENSKCEISIKVSRNLFNLLQKFRGEDCLRIILNDWMMRISKRGNYAVMIAEDLSQLDLLISLNLVFFHKEYCLQDINLIENKCVSD